MGGHCKHLLDYWLARDLEVDAKVISRVYQRLRESVYHNT